MTPPIPPVPHEPGEGPTPVPTMPPPPNAAGGLWLVDAGGAYSRVSDTVPPITVAPSSDDE